MDVAATDNFRKNLAVAIEARGLRKAHVAEQAKTSRMHLDRILKGEMEPGLNTSERLAKAVSFPLVALLEAPDIFSEAVLTSVT
jgi:DNA-binding phage protein